MTMLMGDDEKALAIAAEIREKCLAKIPPVSHRSEDNYWLLATLGEVALILGENLEDTVGASNHFVTYDHS